MDNTHVNELRDFLIEGLVRAAECQPHHISILASVLYREVRTNVCYAIAPSDEKGSYTYLRDGKRVKTRFARIVRKVLKIEAEDHIIAGLEFFLGPQIWDEEIEEIEGINITKHYKYEAPEYSYSCMTHRNAPVTLYRQAPVKLLVVPHKARALLWKLDDGNYFLDRIYPDNCKQAGQCLIRHAKKNYNAVIRTEIFGNGAPNTQVGEDRYIVTFTFRGKRYPFMDSFCYSTGLEGRISLSNVPWEDSYVLKQPYGGYKRDAFYPCDKCNKMVRIDRLHRLESNHYCSECARPSERRCEFCDSHNFETNSIYVDSGLFHVCTRCRRHIESGNITIRTPIGSCTCSDCRMDRLQNELIEAITMMR